MPKYFIQYERTALVAFNLLHAGYSFTASSVYKDVTGEIMDGSIFEVSESVPAELIADNIIQRLGHFKPNGLFES